MDAAITTLRIPIEHPIPSDPLELLSHVIAERPNPQARPSVASLPAVQAFDVVPTSPDRPSENPFASPAYAFMRTGITHEPLPRRLNQLTARP